MDKVYGQMIKRKLRDITQVPDRILKDVKIELKRLGIDGYGNPIE